MLILEHSYWLKLWSNQSEFYDNNIFAGLGPALKKVYAFRKRFTVAKVH